MWTPPRLAIAVRFWMQSCLTEDVHAVVEAAAVAVRVDAVPVELEPQPARSDAINTTPAADPRACPDSDRML
jgi:hypothetical protein